MNQEVPFVFEDHVLRMDYNGLEARLEERRNLFTHLWVERKLSRLRELKKTSDKEYHFWRDFFARVNAQDLCTLTYTEFDEDRCQRPKLHFKGENVVSFDVIGKPYCKTDPKTGFKQTAIPVMMGTQREQIIIDDHVQKVWPLFEKIDIDYIFQFDISLGRPFQFTQNPLITSTGDWFDKTEEHYFFGAPGRIYFRTNDAFTHQLFDNITARIKELDKKVPWSLSVSVYVNHELYYAGTMQNTGTFPFFIERDEDKKRSTTPEPKESMVSTS